MMYKYRISVFTPTYNRAYRLESLYRSLCRQKFADFEWLVVDDGSTDDTEDLVYKWRKEAHFRIQYYKTENGGKHRAINYGLDRADGELFFTVDSDDELTEDALEKIDEWFKSIKQKINICGIAANRGTTRKTTPNSYFKSSYLDKTWLEVYSYQEDGKLVLSGERAIVFYTDFHKKYYFPEFSGENFLTEAVIYNRIAHDGYKLRFYNDIIWIFEYRDDGLTKAGNSIFLNNPQGYGLWLREKAKFQKYSVVQLLKMYYAFTCELEELYDSSKIAHCIGAPKVLIDFLKKLHKIYRFIKETFLHLRKD